MSIYNLSRPSHGLSAEAQDRGGDFCNGGAAGIDHRRAQLLRILVQQEGHAFLSSTYRRYSHGPTDQNRLGSQAQHLEGIHTAADSAVNENFDLPFDGGRDLRQHFRRSRGMIQHPAPMVGNDDARGAGLDRQFRISERS